MLMARIISKKYLINIQSQIFLRSVIFEKSPNLLVFWENIL